MRRLLTRLSLALPLLSFGCATTSAAAPAPAVTVSSATAAESKLWLAGQLDASSLPATFRLRTDLGCAHDAALETTMRAGTFSVGLGAGDLEDAFACAIDVDSGEVALPPITVTPGADATTTSTDIRLDPSFAVAAVDLEARSGHVVRFTVISDSPLAEAHVTLAGTTYGARLAPALPDDAEEGTLAIFEVPARAWASAVIDGAKAHVDAKQESGDYRSLVLAPLARIETLSEAPTDAEEPTSEP